MWLFLPIHLSLTIKKIQLSLCIVGLKTWSHIWVQLTFPFSFLHERDFILARSFDLKVHLVWMGRTHNDVVKDGNDKHYRMVHVQWWVPCKKGTCNDVELYQDYWQGRWKCNLTYPIQWVDIDWIKC